MDVAELYGFRYETDIQQDRGKHSYMFHWLLKLNI